MRIGLLTASLSRRGGNVSAASSTLGRSLHRPPEVDIAAFGLHDEITDSDLGAWGTVNVIAASARGVRKFGFSRDLDRALAEADLDLLHVHGLWTYTSVASRRWADATARPYIVTPHGMLDPWAVRRSWWKKVCAGLLFELAHLRGAACLHARCQLEVEELRALKLRSPVCVIPNPVEPTQEKTSSQQNLSLLGGTGKKVLLCPGPVLVDANSYIILRAWHLARTHSARLRSDWSLVVVGPEQDSAQLARECTALQVEKTVYFAPVSASAARELWEGASAAVLLPAASEQTMNAVRAWSHGLPVLLCGARRIHADLGVAPALVVQPTIERLAEGLLQLVGMSHKERASMGARARRLVAPRVAPAVIAEDMTQVYRWTLGRGPKPSCVVEY